MTKNEVTNETLKYFNGDTLATDVFVSKYCLRDKQGNFYEKDPEDMHKRLAREFARIESKYPNSLNEEQIFNLLDKFRYIIPQGSPMTGIGNDFQTTTLSNCFVKGTKVFVFEKGIVNIEDVEIGDTVLTHKGNRKPVSQLHKNLLKDRTVFDIKVYKTPHIKVTDNHNFLSITKEQLEWGEPVQWNSVDKLRKGDYIAIPKNNNVEKKRDYVIDISRYFTYEEDINRDYLVDIGSDKITLTTLTNGNGKGKHKRIHNPLNRFWKIDDDFAKMIGIWYGDGCVYSGEKGSSLLKGIGFTFNKKEQESFNFIKNYCENLFGVHAAITTKNKDKDSTISITFNSSYLAFIFNNLFGRGARKKYIWKDMYLWDDSMISNLIIGFISADGVVTATGDLRVTVINQDIIYNLYNILRNRSEVVGMSIFNQRGDYENGYTLNFLKFSKYIKFLYKEYGDNRIEKFSKMKLKNQQHILNMDGYTLLELKEKKKIKITDEYVYTLGVEDDHSYTVEGLITQNCYVIEDPHDSYSGIFKTEQEMIQLMKRRGGVGFSIHSLRPKAMPTGSVAEKSSGIVLFSERYSNGTREVAQDGRRGALMLSCSVNHPDIEDFIDAKLDLKKITGANISVMITDEFMEAVIENKDYDTVFIGDKGEYKRTVNARSIWNKIINNAWSSAEPGVLFWDTVLRESPAGSYGSDWVETSTNPCSELPLPPYDSCRLLAINLYSYVVDAFGKNSFFDEELFASHVRVAQRLMDDLVDLEIEKVQKVIYLIESDNDPEELKQVELNLWKKILEKTIRGRRTGLGITALGDTLAALNLTYGTPKATEMAERIVKILAQESYTESIILAKERGSFLDWDLEKEKNNPFISRILNSFNEGWDSEKGQDNPILFDYEKYGRRNIANLTIAPTGSVSTLSQTTSGIEPAFMIYYKRRRKTNDKQKATYIDSVGDMWEEYNVFHHKFVDWYNKNWYKTDSKLFDIDFHKPIETFTDKELQVLIQKSPYHKATSNDVDWVEKVRMQGEIQKWIDHSISVTVNVPQETSREVVEQIYMEGWKSGCKGMTIYRDGSRSGILVNPNEKKEESKGITYTDAPKRPKTLECDIFHKVGLGERWMIIVGILEKKPYEIFAIKGVDNSIFNNKIDKGQITRTKSGHYSLTGEYNGKTYVIENIVDYMPVSDMNDTRKYSTQLRHGIKPMFISEQIDKFASISGFDKVIGKVLKLYTNGEIKKDKCPECGSDLIYQDGCVKCTNCSFSLC